MAATCSARMLELRCKPGRVSRVENQTLIFALETAFTDFNFIGESCYSALQ